MTDPKEELEQFARGISGEAHLERISGRTAWEDRWVSPSSYYDSIGVVRGKVTRRKERRLRVKHNAYRRKVRRWKMRYLAAYRLLEWHRLAHEALQHAEAKPVC